MAFQCLSSDAPMPDALRGAVAALGNFDGFHLGHQAVAARAVEQARAEGRVAIVATFDPHPMRLFRPDTPPFRLTTLEQRAQLFEAAGADAMLVFNFTREMAEMTPEAFVRDMLVERLGLAAVVTGQDMTFGKGRAGDIDTLRDLGARYGLAAAAVAPVRTDGDAVSSSRIREALRAGDPHLAARLLTRPFAIRGEVVHGDKNGRKLGFPTANLELGNYLRPAYGVYAVRGHLPDGRVLAGAANIGIRPSFDPPKELLEPYFFDFDGDLYGQTIEVSLTDYLRPEMKFDDLDLLSAQMREDCERARLLLGA